MKMAAKRLLSTGSLNHMPPLALRLIRSSKMLRALAARARRRDDRTTDVFYRRRVCEIRPGDENNWVQLGHALKELGFYGRAQDAYAKALSLQPRSADIYLELAHLAKLRGDFAETERYFVKAEELDHPAANAIASERKLLKRIDNTDVFFSKIIGEEKTGTHIYLSAPAALIKEDNKSDLSSGLGQSDYSYVFAMRGFIAALDQLGYGFTVLTNPEFVSDIRERSNARINIHLGFYPPERLRLLKGAYNINLFAWEFDRLRASSEVLNYHAFSDQTTMLDTVDELWIPSAHGADAVAKSVTKPVYAVASPILGNLRPVARDAMPDKTRVWDLAQALAAVSWQPLAVFARVQASVNEDARLQETNLPGVFRHRPSGKKPIVFLTILNVHDFRKQLYPMLQGFLEFRVRHPEAFLLVKMTTPDRGKMPINSFLLMDQISNAGELPRPLVSDHVWITDQILSREELNHLYDMSSFYVCTSYAEGQNLPLLEAMGRGVVPVSVDNTAMADYISEETAIPIRSDPRPLGPRLASRYGLYGLETNYVEAEAVRQAFERAAVLKPQDYAVRSAAALAMVQERYGAAPVAKALERVIAKFEISGKDG